MENIWNFFVKRSSFSSLVIVALVLFGLYSALVIPKESNPEVVVPIGVVTTILPGASAEDVEKLVTNKIEDQLINGLDGVKQITSSSGESLSSIVIEFNPEVDIPSSIQEVKDEVDKVKSELPDDANDPAVLNVDFSSEPIMLLSVTSDLPVTEFIKLSDQVIDELKKVKGVSKVEKSGIREREVQVIVKKEALDKFDINLLDVVQAISASNVSLPIGNIQLEGVDYTVRFKGDIENTSDISDIAILNKSGEPVYLRDIAFISDGVGKAASFSRVSVGGEISQQAISLAVFKKKGGDITKTSDAIKEKLEELQEGILKDYTVLVSFDTGEFVKEDLRKLSFTGLQTVILVMIILLVAIGWRESVVAGLAIPLSFLIAFIGLLMSGNTINFVSLFSLILAVGILVDSAIVMTEGIHMRIGKFDHRMDAAVATIKEFHWPLMSGTMTTVAVFAPLFLISGITGQFIASIPFTIIFVLLASLFVALGVVPLLSALFLRRKGEQTKFGEKQERYTEKLQNWYRGKLDKILGFKKKERLFIFGVIVLFVASLLLPITGLVKTIFFASEDSDFIFVEVETLQGSVLGNTDLIARQVEDVLYEDTRVESFVTTVGAKSNFTGDFSGGGGAGSKFANMTVLLDKDRKDRSSEVVKDLRLATAHIKNADVRILELSSGPPTGAPVFIRFVGDDLDDLDQVLVSAEKILRKIPGTVDVATSASNDGTEFVFTINRAKASELGLSAQMVAQTLRTAVQGFDATTITNNGEDVDVVVKLNLNTNFIDPHDTARTSIDSLRYVQIETPKGAVLLGSVVELSLDKSNAVISHTDGKRVLSITSEVQEDFIASDVLEEFISGMEEVELPDGVEMKIGGESDDVQQSFQDMFVSLIIGMVLIVAILVLQFNSYKQALMIISIVPLGLIGILFGLFISGKTLSFPSLMGFIALSGIVVNNSIILIDRMNKLRKEKPWMDIKTVVIESAVSRLRPILLTTLTTVIGIIPLTYATELWSPLAYSIIFGLSFAVLITLILVPILYNRWPGNLK